MTFSEALHRKIYKIRLPWFPVTAYVDPRVVEDTGKGIWTPIIDPVDPPKNEVGKIQFSKMLIDYEEDIWSE